MVEITDYELLFSFPNVNNWAMLCVHFRSIASPAGGVPIFRNSDDRLVLGAIGSVAIHLRPSSVAERLLPRPNVPSEGGGYPFAVLITVGGLNALTGKPSNTLERDPQNYFVTPPQGGIDGYFAQGEVHPFRAGPEIQRNNTQLDIQVCPMKSKTWNYLMYQRSLCGAYHPVITGLTLAHGGERKCEPVYEDLCCIGDWDQSCSKIASVWLK